MSFGPTLYYILLIVSVKTSYLFIYLFQEEEKTGLWNAVASILGRIDDAGSIMVKAKDVKEAYQQQQQLENEVMQLNSTINEYNKMLAEKQQTIEDLRGYIN